MNRNDAFKLTTMFLSERKIQYVVKTTALIELKDSTLNFSPSFIDVVSTLADKKEAKGLSHLITSEKYRIRFYDKGIASFVEALDKFLVTEYLAPSLYSVLNETYNDVSDKVHEEIQRYVTTMWGQPFEVYLPTEYSSLKFTPHCSKLEITTTDQHTTKCKRVILVPFNQTYLLFPL